MATNGPVPIVPLADKCDADAHFRNGDDETGVGSVQDATVAAWNTAEKKKEKKKKPKATAKSTVPPVVTKEGTYYRLPNITLMRSIDLMQMQQLLQSTPVNSSTRPSRLQQAVGYVPITRRCFQAYWTICFQETIILSPDRLLIRCYLAFVHCATSFLCRFFRLLCAAFVVSLLFFCSFCRFFRLSFLSFVVCCFW